MPEGFAFPPGQVDQSEAWTALQLDPKSTNRGGHYLDVLGRLAPGVSLNAARQEMQRLVAGWGRYNSPNFHALSPGQHPVTAPDGDRLGPVGEQPAEGDVEGVAGARAHHQLGLVGLLVAGAAILAARSARPGAEPEPEAVRAR